MAGVEDPFYAVKRNVEALLAQRPRPYSRSTKTSVAASLTDLAQTVSIVDAYRDKFPNITDDELARRRAFITSACTQAGVPLPSAPPLPPNAPLSSLLARPAVSKKQSSQQRPSSEVSDAAKLEKPQRLAPSSERLDASQERWWNADPVDVNAALRGHRHQQLEMERKEDLVLEDMQQALERLGGMAKDIGSELEAHNHDLDKLDYEVENQNAYVKNVLLVRMEKMLKSNRWVSWNCCLCTLGVIAIVLILLLIYS